ncbi:putative toxin-antitoxin system toxin component, PIN family [Roseateles sp. UC29_93]|uniref:PIN domain-containing protein n=1 Tax=Roseateles sp. UC29_93 TaxID=3350177 RepID=UPI00366F2A93
MTRRSKKTAPELAVIDPALILRALLMSGGEALGLRRAWQQGVLRPLVSPDLAATLMRALAYPKLVLSEVQQQELLADFLPYAEVVKPARGPRIAGVSESMQSLVELALQGGASLLLCDDSVLSAWSANSRSQAARQLCTVRAMSAWFQVLPPSQRDMLLC